MMHFRQLRDLVVRPVLELLDKWNFAAENLIVGTISVESRGEYLKQLGGGPALGICQMEPATHDSLWENYLNYRPGIAKIVKSLATGIHPRQDGKDFPHPRELEGNLYYSVAMCRIKYLQDSQPIPDDVQGQAAYWKRVYNSAGGAGTVEKYIEAYERTEI